MSQRITAALIWLSGCAVAGCGGGGSDPPAAPEVSANLTSISLTKTVAELAPPVTFQVTASSTTGNTLYADVRSSGAAVVGATWTNPSSLTADVTVQFPVPGDLSPGTVTGEVQFLICADQACAQPLRGSPITIPVTLTIQALAKVGATVAPLLIDATAMRGVNDAAPRANVNVGFAAPIAGNPVVVASHGRTIVANVASTLGSQTGIAATIEFLSPDSLQVGAHSDALTVNVCYTASCANSAIATPLRIPLTYTVKPPGPRLEPGSQPLVPVRSTALPHDVIDAEYSKALEAVVMVGSYPTNALYVYYVNQRLERQLPLNKVPTAISIGPTGVFAAVGHDALVTHVDLRSVGVANSPAPKLLNVSTKVFDIVLDGRGYVHAFPLEDQWVNMHSVSIATNTESIGDGLFYDSERARLHPSGDYIYGANNGLSPSDIEKFDVRQVPTQRLYDSPYHGTYGMCGNLWFAETGINIFTACGNVFRASTVMASDMTYAGSLQLSSGAGTPFGIRSLSQSEAKREIVLVEDDEYYCRLSQSLYLCFSHVVFYGSDFLTRNSVRSLAPMTVSGQDYVQNGLLVFHSADGARRFMISRLLGMPNPLAEYYLSEF